MSLGYTRSIISGHTCYCKYYRDQGIKTDETKIIEDYNSIKNKEKIILITFGLDECRYSFLFESDIILLSFLENSQTEIFRKYSLYSKCPLLREPMKILIECKNKDQHILINTILNFFSKSYSLVKDDSIIFYIQSNNELVLKYLPIKVNIYIPDDILEFYDYSRYNTNLEPTEEIYPFIQQIYCVKPIEYREVLFFWYYNIVLTDNITEHILYNKNKIYQLFIDKDTIDKLAFYKESNVLLKDVIIFNKRLYINKKREILMLILSIDKVKNKIRTLLEN